MNVPADLLRRIEDTAADMAVPAAWVLRACVEVGLSRDIDENELVLAVERVRDDPTRVVRMPKVTRCGFEGCRRPHEMHLCPLHGRM